MMIWLILGGWGFKLMKAKQDLPNICYECECFIKKGDQYLYRESKKYEREFAYFHRGCKK